MKYDVLLADADGTLLDFHAGEKAALEAVLQAFGIPADDETVALYSRINEGHWKKLERGETTQERLRVERFEDFLKAVQVRADAEDMCNRFMGELGEQRILIAGAEAFCKAVSAQIPIYMVTNGLSAVQRNRFRGAAITPYLAGLLISEEVGHSKPEPHMLLEGMRLAGVADPRRAVLLGDSVTADIGAAQNAGMDSILFTNGKPAPEHHGATYVAQTLREAEALVLQ